LIAQAATGTGKTLAFALPCVESMNADDKNVQALILCPTRELAVQVSNELRKLTLGQKIFVTPVYGGQEMQVQLKALKRGTHIVVGTPGRVKDHLQRGSLKLGKVKYLVLDEADQMLDMGFVEEIDEIIARIPKSRQTIMFSATMSSKLKELAKRFQKNAKQINLVSKNKAANLNIKQLCMRMKNSAKDQSLEALLQEYKIFSGIIFCNTKRKVDELSRLLTKKKYSVASIHGDIKQRKRDRVMKDFKKGAFELLVATDVAARGIDVDNLEAVINYDLPRFDEDYIHRIGRTGRAGKNGLAFNFVTKNDSANINRIAKKHKLKLEYA
jgi:ATP-dependent RNA helicase DeaD